jgi:hypothetical protein
VMARRSHLYRLGKVSYLLLCPISGFPEISLTVYAVSEYCRYVEQSRTYSKVRFDAMVRYAQASPCQVSLAVRFPFCKSDIHCFCIASLDQGDGVSGSNPRSSLVQCCLSEWMVSLWQARILDGQLMIDPRRFRKPLEWTPAAHDGCSLACCWGGSLIRQA